MVPSGWPGVGALPLPDNGGTVKKSMAASLYDLDSEDGE